MIAFSEFNFNKLDLRSLKFEIINHTFVKICSGEKNSLGISSYRFAFVCQ